MGLLSTFRDVKQWDEQRASIPGEHWLALGLGLLVLSRSGRSRSLLGRMAGKAIGGAFLARSASGRDGIRKLVRSPRHLSGPKENI